MHENARETSHVRFRSPGGLGDVQPSLPIPREEFNRALRDSCHILLNVNKHTEQLLASVNFETIYSHAFVFV
ncbi:hypothetical protein VTO58DRAFT_111605 [Aureobasidium pullulans]